MRVILAAFLITGISACGQTGPLYLPDSAPPKNQPSEDAGGSYSSSQSR
ncbi:MAG: lipoprotein [Sulfuritalea sp.]|nr:lipoprotein [Polynucleobacter sp.]MCF8187914.1 lipoprotein [Sulfuritalea sp.]